MGAFQRLLDLGDRLLGGRLADFRPRTGAEALGDLEAELDALIRRARVERLGIRVGDDEIDSLDVRIDHVRNGVAAGAADRSEEHTSELQSLMRISYAVFCLKKKQEQTKIETSIIMK